MSWRGSNVTLAGEKRDVTMRQRCEIAGKEDTLITCCASVGSWIYAAKQKRTALTQLLLNVRIALRCRATSDMLRPEQEIHDTGVDDVLNRKSECSRLLLSWKFYFPEYLERRNKKTLVMLIALFWVFIQTYNRHLFPFLLLVLGFQSFMYYFRNGIIIRKSFRLILWKYYILF